MTDLSLPMVGGSWQSSRAYESSRAIDGPLGIGWIPSLGTRLYYAVYLFAAPATYQGEAAVTLPGGGRFRFRETSPGVFTAPPERHDVLLRNGDGSYDLSLQGSRSRIHFGPDGSWQSSIDEFGNIVNATYDGSGRIQQISDGSGSGRYLNVFWGADGRVSSVQDSAGRTVQYGYSAQGNLITVTNPLGQVTTYSYTPGRFAPVLSQVKDNWNRIITSVTYDSQFRVQTYTENGETYTFAYALQGYPNWTQKTDSLGYAWYFTTTTGGYITARQLPGSSYNYTEYTTPNPDGTPASRTDPVGVVTQYTYNSNGLASSVTRDSGGPNAVRYDYTYDSSFPEKATSITPRVPSTGLVDPNWLAWRYDYYQAGDPAPGALHHVYRVRSDGSTLDTLTTYEYDLHGRVTRVTSAAGGVTDYVYDATGNLQTVTGPSNNDTGTRPVTTYGYDSIGRVTSVTDPLGKVTAYTYDALGRVTTITLPKPSISSPLNFVTTYSYDNFDSPSGLVFVNVTDPNGRITKQGYDQFGRLVKSVDSANNATTYAYSHGVLTSITDANSNVTSYTYDAVHQLTRTTFPDGSHEDYTYTGDGLLKEKTDRSNLTPIVYSYDSLKRLTLRMYGPNGFGFAYQGQKLTQVGDSTVYGTETHTFAYDPSYRLQSETQAGRGTITRTYNADDTVATMTVQSGPAATYSYYPDGSLNTIQWSPVAGNFKYSYSLPGQYQAINFPNGQSRNFTYDDQGRLTQLSNLATGGTNIATYGYGYDLNYTTGQYTMLGQRVSLTATVPSQALSNHLTKYEYDTLYELNKVTYPNVAPFNGEVDSWTYDAIGNRLTNTVNGATTNYTYQKIGANPNNWQRLLSDGSNSYTYTPNGSTATRSGPGGNFTFAWTGTYTWENRLYGISGATTATYAYDYQGRRSTKTVGSVTTYLYDGLNLVHEAGASSADYLFGPGIDEPLAMSRGGQVYYYETDALGSVNAVTDSSASAQNTYLYDAWGQVKSQTGPLANPFTYTSREVGEAGLNFYRARYYSSGIGRFLSEDPAGQPDPTSLNERQARPHEARNDYTYVANEPSIFRDPAGLRKCASGRCPDCPSGNWWSFSASGSVFGWGGGTTGTTTYYCLGSPLAVTFTYSCWSAGMGIDLSLGASTGPVFGGKGCVCAEDLGGFSASYEAGYGAGVIGFGGGFGASQSSRCAGGFAGGGFGLSMFQRVNFHCSYRQFSYTPF